MPADYGHMRDVLQVVGLPVDGSCFPVPPALLPLTQVPVLSPPPWRDRRMAYGERHCCCRGGCLALLGPPRVNHTLLTVLIWTLC